MVHRSIVDISSRISTDAKYIGGVLAPNGHIYMVPFHADNIGDFDPSTNAFDVIDISSRISTKYNGEEGRAAGAAEREVGQHYSCDLVPEGGADCASESWQHRIL